MTSVFLTISLLCLWIYVLNKEHQNNKRYKETLNVMKRMWDFEKRTLWEDNRSVGVESY